MCWALKQKTVKTVLGTLAVKNICGFSYIAVTDLAQRIKGSTLDLRSCGEFLRHILLNLVQKHFAMTAYYMLGLKPF